MSAAQAQPAAARSPQKVLRIGVVQDGKVARERLMRVQEVVSVGDGPRATFALAGTQIGAEHELFSPKGDGYVLQVPDWVEGKISWKDGIRGLDELRARGDAVRKGDLWLIALNDNVKGKVTIGNTTILFQFVQAPPEPVRPISPADFRRPMMDDDDPLFLGLLGVFSVIAAVFMLYVYTAPRNEREEVDIETIRDLIRAEPVPVVEAKPDEGVGAETKPEKKPEAKPTEPKPDAGASSGTASAPSEDSVAKKSLLLQMFGTNANGEGQAADIIGAGANDAALDQALAGVSGAQQANAGDIGVKTGGAGGRGDAEVGLGLAKGGGASTTAVQVVVKKPKVDFGREDASVDEGDAGSIASTMRKSQGRVATCVETALRTQPDLNGRVSVSFQVTKGKVSDVQVLENSSGNAALGGCIATAVRGVRFPEDLTASVAEYPFIVSGQ